MKTFTISPSFSTGEHLKLSNLRRYCFITTRMCKALQFQLHAKRAFEFYDGGVELNTFRSNGLGKVKWKLLTVFMLWPSIHTVRSHLIKCVIIFVK